MKHLSRRQFLKRAAVASAAISILPAILTKPVLAQSPKIVDLSQQIPPTGLERLNARQFIDFVKKNVEEILWQYNFELNDTKTRAMMQSHISGYMDEVGRIPRTPMMDHHVVCDESNNSPQTVDKYTQMNIYMKLHGYAEYVDLRIIISTSGYNFDSISV